MKTLPQPWTAAMEATMLTVWIYDHLRPHAAALKVAHPLMLRAIAAAKKNFLRECGFLFMTGGHNRICHRNKFSVARPGTNCAGQVPPSPYYVICVTAYTVFQVYRACCVG